MQHTRAALLAVPDLSKDARDLAVCQAICRDILDSIGCTRASLWRYLGDGDAIRCVSLQDQRGPQFPQDILLAQHGIPLYFELMQKERLLVIPDYAQHPATRNLGAPYAQSTGIRALIDVLIAMPDGTPLAIVSAEQDRARDWRETDILFMFQIADLATPLFRQLGRLVAEI